MLSIVGRRDTPTDGVWDYCGQLGKALSTLGVAVDLSSMAWDRFGWRRSLGTLSDALSDRKGEWALVHHTHLSWPSRGFPFGLLSVLRVLQWRGVRGLVVLHDPSPFPGNRLRDKARRRAQIMIMRQATRLAEAVVSTVPPENIDWLRAAGLTHRVTHIQVGSNIPERWQHQRLEPLEPPTIVVFGVTPTLPDEALILARVARRTAELAGPFRFIVCGRGSQEVASVLRAALAGTPVDLRVPGLLTPEAAADTLAQSALQLFIRRGISTRRTSAIAGIGCGLPIVSYADAETSFPITEAGVALVPEGDEEGLATNAAAILGDGALRDALRARSRAAMKNHFAWEVIARRYLTLLRRPTPRAAGPSPSRQPSVACSQTRTRHIVSPAR